MTRRALGPAILVATLLTATAAAHDLAEEVEQIDALIGLRPGMRLADVGAGEGEFSEELVDRVGDSGHVYVTEVSERELKRLRRTFDRIDNATVIEGTADDTELPDACCDAVLLRYVYHHMSERSEMRASLRRSLRPGGLLLVIEKTEPGDGVAEDELVVDMTGDGFEVVSRHPEWGEHDGHYGVVFRRSPGP